MKRKIYGYMLPDYTPENSIFHYTSADGLIGIISSGQMWCTATHSTNDESELAFGQGIIAAEFSKVVQTLITNGDSRIETFYSRGVDVTQFADNYAELVINTLFSSIRPYIACFCQAEERETFYNGLLSQWRGYGIDGGYAIQFNKNKLRENLIESYSLEDVSYSIDNQFKDKLINSIESFNIRFLTFLDEMLEFNSMIPSPLSGVSKKAIECLFEYTIQTKSHHFNEEREVRLSIHDSLISNEVKYFSRNGLIVPYKETDKTALDLTSCIEGIIIGPSPRTADRYNSVQQLLQNNGIIAPIRISEIPFTRS